MYEYSHGGNAVFERGGGDIIDLSASINPLGMPENVRDAIDREIPGCCRYPDSVSGKLRGKIAEFRSVDPDRIFCGNGASDIIFRIPRALHAKRVMVTAPTFSDYERSALSYGSEVIRYALSPANEFDTGDGLIEAVKNITPDLVFICNPNNPTGRLTEPGIIEELLDCCRRIGAWVAVDECFLDFAQRADEYTSKVFLERYPNLLLLNAFTKLFALPGVRLGYVVCADKSIVDSICFHGADWPVSNLAQAAGMAALEGAEGFIRKTSEYVSAGRRMIEETLAQLGFRVFESKVNYVFFRSLYPFDLYDELDAMGIRIRPCDNFHGLDGSYYRVAVSDQTNNARFIEAVTEAVKPYSNGY